jgi:hypothetical protein
MQCAGRWNCIDLFEFAEATDGQSLLWGGCYNNAARRKTQYLIEVQNFHKVRNEKMVLKINNPTQIMSGYLIKCHV